MTLVRCRFALVAAALSLLVTGCGAEMDAAEGGAGAELEVPADVAQTDQESTFTFVSMGAWFGPWGTTRLIDYGCFCGGWTNGGPNGKPVDKWDAACQTHDNAWAACTAKHGAYCGDTGYSWSAHWSAPYATCNNAPGTAARCCCDADKAFFTKQRSNGTVPSYYAGWANGNPSTYKQTCCSASCGAHNNYCGKGSSSCQ